MFDPQKGDEMEDMDLRGKPCPIPVIEVKRKLPEIQAGESLLVLVDNDIARQNLQKLAEGKGYAFVHEKTPEGDIRATFTLSDSCPVVDVDGGKGLVVAIGSDCMGSGSDELGRALMKSFLFSLTELNFPPEYILFFNAGVHLTCEGSTALADLSALAGKGVFINSCGACLNFYRKTDALKVGGVTNMFAILETMGQAKRLIQL